ncbi:IPP transferase family protein [Leishmania donovani]|uniref:IPP transferase family protein n=1 Tax=Leishmania donovani TaxID=5661 RepID=A0A504XVS4_LEIDO|nr:IPP transferase family protein [Leishmania donovani]
MRTVDKPVFFVIGSTGSGKSRVAIYLAQELRRVHNYKDVVIINCDVYQCYTDLPILTNKPSATDLGGVTHLCLGLLSSDGSVICDNNGGSVEQREFCHEAQIQLTGNASFNVHSYERIVTSFINGFFQRHADGAVIICGGTCYYAQALLFADSLVYDREQHALCSYTDSDAEDGLWELLSAVDAEVALRYHPNDRRRIKRLLEIYDSTGQAPSAIFDSQASKLRFDSNALFIVWVRMEREVLDDFLNRRVDLMLQRGMLGEVKAFWLKNGRKLPHNSLSGAIGCKEFSQFFTSDNPSLISSSDCENAVAQIKSNTRRYARQQERWIQNRLLPLLHSSSLKEAPTHFVQLWVQEGVDALPSVQRTLDTFLGTSPVQPLAESLFPLKQQLASREPVSQKECKICKILVYGRGQMVIHLKSKRHRGSLRRLALEKEHREKYGRELPPPKRKRNS